MAERKMFDAEAEERRWWERWWAEDYSWEGLGRLDARGVPKKRWNGWVVVKRNGAEFCEPHSERNEHRTVRFASLQDYWRADPEDGWRLRSEEQMRANQELISFSSFSQNWHIAHFPINLQDETENSWKGNLEAPEWNHLNKILEVRVINSDRSKILFSELGLELDNKAQFEGVVIRDNIAPSWHEEDGLFLNMKRSAHLERAFYGAYKFGDSCIFEDAFFSKGADFTGSEFLSGANFNGSIFKEETRFSQSNIHGPISFIGSRFLSVALFYFTKFCDHAEFTWCEFHGTIEFNTNEFNSGANFIHTYFRDLLNLFNSTFSGDLEFSHANFTGDVHFIRLILHGKIRYIGANFKRKANFGIIEFEGPENHWRGSFDTALFEDFVDFRKSSYKLISMFDGARLEGGIAYPKPGEMDALRIFDKEVIDPILNGEIEQRDDALKAVEHGAQVLKHQMRLASDSLREQRFYRFELIARRLQSTTHWSERYSSRLFGWFSDYGLSVSRPLAWLGASIIIFASAYLSLAHSACAFNEMACPPSAPAPIVSAEPHRIDARPAPERLFQLYAWDMPSERLSAWLDAPRRRVEELPYLPGPFLFAVELGFIPVSDPMGHHTWAKDLSKQESWQSALFAFLRMTQRLISLILIFLTALALRRRFQIG
jgi:uncharacterized protein YjbI with pentapeptide repeats